MTKTKREKAEELAQKIEEMTNRKKLLLQEAKEEDRKNRTHRLCKRGGLLESLMPETLDLNDDQFRNFLEMTMLTDYTRSRLSDARSGKLSHHSAAQVKNPSQQQKSLTAETQKPAVINQSTVTKDGIA